MGFLFSDTFKCIRPLKAHIQQTTVRQSCGCNPLQADSRHSLSTDALPGISHEVPTFLRLVGAFKWHMFVLALPRIGGLFKAGEQ